jgi:hypothetical protein
MPVILQLFHMVGEYEAFLTQGTICEAEHTYVLYLPRYAVSHLYSHRPNHIDMIYSLKRTVESANVKLKTKYSNGKE